MSAQVLRIIAVFFCALGVCFFFRTVYAAVAARIWGKGIRVYTVIEAEGDAASLELCVRAAALAGEKMLSGGEIYIIDKGMSDEARRLAELLEVRQRSLRFIRG